MSGTPEGGAAAAARPAPGSRWAFQIATVFGIPIRIHVTFLILLVWFGMMAAASSRQVPREIVVVLGVFACVVLHELGHALMARRFGVTTREIVLYPIGGVARLEHIPSGWAELLIAIAGPLVNVAIALACTVLMAARGIPPQWLAAPSWHAGLIPKLLWVNVVLVVFNMIPAFPMDGGRVLRALLAIGIGQDRATTIAAVVGQLFAVLFVVGGLWRGMPLLAFVGVFVFLGATQEAAFQRSRAAVAGRTIKEAMITKFETLRPDDSLGRAAELLLASHQHDFPVIDAWGRIAGVLPRSILLEGLAKAGSAAPVLDTMQREPATVGSATPLDAALRLLQGNPSAPLLVVDDGTLVGMLTLENLAEFIVIAGKLPAR